MNIENSKIKIKPKIIISKRGRKPGSLKINNKTNIIVINQDEKEDKQQQILVNEKIRKNNSIKKRKSRKCIS